jgi:glycosyltransferase involved in cell wall biosynthesis
MRVLMILEAGGGAARHVVDLCCGLHNKGIDVHLVYSPNRMDSLLDEGLKKLAKLSVKLVSVPMIRKPGLSDLFSYFKIWQYARDNGPFDIVHGHSSKGGALARLLYGAGIKAKVYSAHAFVTMDTNLGWFESSLYALAEKFLAHVGNAVIVTSFSEKKHAENSLRIPNHKTFLIPNGIDKLVKKPSNCRHDFRYAWGVRDDEVLLGTVTRFVEQKAPHVLLGAFAEVVKHVSNVRLVMVGDGPLKQQLMNDAEKLGVASLVVWPGYINHESLMEALDIFALSSLYEGFPYVLLDALFTGLPLVSTQVGGSDMVIAPGKNGFIAPCGDVEQMGKFLSTLSCDDYMRKKMGQASLLKAKEFSAQEMVEKCLDVYSFLLSSS